jgi:hypothetical protein
MRAHSVQCWQRCASSYEAPNPFFPRTPSKKENPNCANPKRAHITCVHTGSSANKKQSCVLRRLKKPAKKKDRFANPSHITCVHTGSSAHRDVSRPRSKPPLPINKELRDLVEWSWDKNNKDPRSSTRPVMVCDFVTFVFCLLQIFDKSKGTKSSS